MRVQGPNGIIVDFPDGTDEGTIGRVMQQASSGGASVAPALDRYQKAAQDDLAANQKLGIPSDDGFKRQILNGATFNGAPTILAALDTPSQMLAHGTFDPREGYNYAKAYQTALNDASDKNTGIAGKAAGLVAGIGSGMGLANAGATFVKAGQSLLPRAAAMAGDGAAYGGLTGFNSGDGLTDRLTKGAEGAAAGGAIGGALPVVGSALGTAAAPLISNIRAANNPAGVAESQLARALMESGRDPGAVAGEVANAAAGGQGNFTLADALGNAGQRMLSGVARSPGEGRTQVADFLENRQAGQARSVGNILADGLGAQKTAAQTTADLTAQRGADAATNYGAARAGASPVDVAPAIQQADAALPAVSPGQQPLSIADTFDAQITPQQPFSAPPSPYSTGPQNPGPAPKSQTLIDFLKKRGGVQDPGGDLKSMGMGAHPGLINRAGLPIDTARELAEQAGYLGHYNQNNLGNSSVADFIDAVGDHPKFTPDVQIALDQHGAAKNAFNDYQTSYRNARSRIVNDLLETGHKSAEINPDLLDHAAHMTAQGDVPWQNAYESAAMQSVENAPRGAAPKADFPGGSPQPAPPSDAGVRDNSIEAVVRRAKSYLTDGTTQLSDFSRSFQAKRELDNLIEQGTNSQKHALIPIRDALDEQLSQASPAYANARNVFRQQSQAIDAIPQGRTAAMRGRSEDTIPAFNAMPADQQASFRVGYADPLIEQASNAAPGVNKARPLLGDGPQAELGAMSLHNGPYQPGAQEIMAQRLARENTMFETRNAALGGSKTADNLGDQGALEIDPSVIGHLLHGNFVGAGASALRSIGNGLTGNTPAVRAHLAELLLQHGSAPDLSGTLSRVVGNAQSRQALSAALMRGVATGEGEASGRYLPR